MYRNTCTRSRSLKISIHYGSYLFESCVVSTFYISKSFIFNKALCDMRMVLRSWYSDCLGAGRSWECIPVRATFFCAQPDGQRGSPSLLYNEYRVNGSGCGVDSPSPSSARLRMCWLYTHQCPRRAYTGMACGDL